MVTRVLVTGANKGIGFEIARALAPTHHVLLTSRVVEAGAAARAAILELNPSAAVDVLQLDIRSQESVDACAAEVRARGGVDIVINNAGFAFKSDATEPVTVQAPETVGVNYTGTRRFTEAMLPILRAAAAPRVIFVGSRAGLVSQLRTEALRTRCSRPAPTLAECDAVRDAYLAAVAAGTHRADGWTGTTYAMSKVLEGMYCRALAALEPGINCTICCPGWCRTDMAGEEAPDSAADGAVTPVWLATCDPPQTSGAFFADKKAHPI